MSSHLFGVLKKLEKSLPKDSVIEWSDGNIDSLEKVVKNKPGNDFYNGLVEYKENGCGGYAVTDPTTHKTICTIKPPEEQG